MTHRHPEQRTQGAALTVALLALCVSMAASPGEGGVYYVAPGGNDSNPGTLSQPWRTIQKAADTLVAGDTVQIRAGTYRERVVPVNSGSDASHYITYAAYPAETVTLDGTGIAVPADEGLLYVTGKSYIRISGLRINRSAYAGILVDTSSGIVIERNRIYSTYSSGIGVWNSDHVTVDGNEVEGACTGPWQEHISVANTDTFEVKDNRVHGLIPGTTGKEGICIKDGTRNGTVHGNQVYQIHETGIYVDASDAHTYNIQVYRNIVHDIPTGNGIALASEVGGLLENVRVYNNVAYRNMVGIWVSGCCPDPPTTHPMLDIGIINNTLYDNGLPDAWGGGLGVDNTDLTNFVIRNNIVSQNSYFQLAANASLSTVDHNLIDGFRGRVDEGEIYGSDYVEGDPQFVDAGAAAFQLQSTSPAIDRGGPLGAPSDDFDGSPRPQDGDGDATAAFDIGAFEFGPLLAIDDVSLTEGNAGTSTATFTVTLSKSGAFPITVDYATADGTALAGDDYVAQSGTLSYAVGETSKTIEVVVNGDTAIETNESFSVSLTNPLGGTLADGQGLGTIANDDPQPLVQFSLAGYGVGELSPTASILVTRTGATTGTVTVDYITGAGTATPGDDYEATAGTLTFAAGQTSRSFGVSIVNDTLNEASETVGLILSNPQGLGAALGARPSATLTIADNDPAGSLQFGAAAYSVSETGPAATVKVTRTGGAAGGVTVDYATSDGTATSPADYTATGGTLTLAAGQMSAVFTVPIVDDAIGEDNETVGLTLSTPTGGATLGGTRSAILTILENERVVQFAAPTLTVSEGVPTATIKVKRSGLLAGSLTVDYVTSDGTAKAGVDYQAQAGTLWFGPNVTAKAISMPIVNDTLDEPDETVLVRLRDAVDGAMGPLDSAVVTIADNDAGGVVQFGAPAYSVAENKGTAIVSVTRTGGMASTVTVSYATADGTAHAAPDPDPDYTTTSGTLSFGAGQTAASLQVPVIDDALPEGAETVILTLSNPNGGAALGGRSTAVLSILDDEQTLELGAAAYAVTEGGTATVTVKRTGVATGTVSVPYATTDGTAHGGPATDPSRDYTTTSGTLTFGPNLTTRTFTVPTTNDTLNETAKTLNVTLGTPAGAVLGQQTSASVLIVDNDPAGMVQFGAAKYSVSEAAPSAAIGVTRTGGAASGVTVSYTAAAGTAAADVDFAPVSGTLTFAANQTALTFSVPILGDAEAEGAETVQLSLGPVAGGATLGPRSAATLTINDNDSPQFQLSAPSYSVNEATAKAIITVKRVGNVTSAATIHYATSDGTALDGADYATAGGTLSFPAGVASKTFAVDILNDTLDEPAETLNLTLSSPSLGSQLGSPATALLTIVDNDGAGTVQFGAPVFSTVEGEAGTTSLATITVTRTGGAAGGATVEYTTGNGTATSGSDYTVTAGTLTFAAGAASRTFAVEVLGDAVVEGNETVTLTLRNPAGGLALGTLRAANLWIVEPMGAAKLVFIHHSTGENWLNDTHGQLGRALRDNNYFVSDTNYGWGPGFVGGEGTIGDNTDVGHWYEWFVGTSSATYLDALYHEFGQNSAYARLATDPDPTRENEIVVFKSCFPNSNLGGNPDDPPTSGANPLRGEAASSANLTVANAKGIYNDLLTYFATHPEKLFVLVSSPPLAEGDTSPEAAANARGLANWLVNDWLTGYAHNNVAVLDFYNLLTSNGGSPTVNDLGRQTGNHHRWWNGAVQHVHPVANDVSAYPTADSHPSAAGGKKATGELVTLLNYYYNVWKNLPVVPGAAPLRDARGAIDARLGSSAIAPPGTRVPK